jgi:hypothetical protein
MIEFDIDYYMSGISDNFDSSLIARGYCKRIGNGYGDGRGYFHDQTVDWIEYHLGKGEYD